MVAADSENLLRTARLCLYGGLLERGFGSLGNDGRRKDLALIALDADEHVAVCLRGDHFDRARHRRARVFALTIRADHDQVRVLTFCELEDALGDAARERNLGVDLDVVLAPDRFGDL